jgi:hypothetical protein
MEAAPQALAQAKPTPFFSLARIALIMVPVLSFLGYYAPYVVGLAYHQHLLSLYDVPAGLFESEPRQLFIYAYQAVLEVSGNWKAFILHSYVMPLVFFCVFLFSAEMTALFWFSRTSKLDDAVNRRIKSKWAQLLLAFTVLSAAITGLVAAFPVAIYPFIALPAKLGNFGAEIAFARDKKLFEGGCSVENADHTYCKAVLDKDKILGVGFMIAASDNRVALYQPKQTKILKLGDATIEVMPPDAFKRYEASLPKPGPSTRPAPGT